MILSLFCCLWWLISPCPPPTPKWCLGIFQHRPMELDILLLREKGQYIWIVFHHLVIRIEDDICSFFVFESLNVMLMRAWWCRTSSCTASPRELLDRTPRPCCWSGRAPVKNQFRERSNVALGSKCTFLGSPSLKAITATATHPP